MESAAAGKSERIAQYNALRNPSSDGQAKRRQAALERQRQQRQQAFSLTREGLDAVIEDLDLSGDSEDEPEHTECEQGDARADISASRGEVIMQVESSTSGQKLGVPKSVKKKWKAYADRLMLGEVLDLSEGLPQDLSEQWIALGPVPKGKRCMAVTFASTRTSKKGRVRERPHAARSMDIH
ncbi:MAG: hypothetical protein CYPHOPRED_000647 [Cyphobasidiales sp. Tagirdzhanova-0007]|nr:MAG: hypothetical protein CYPHOPRED_000647 [Cyphobasidiales sp. Tagirdzhanova-0007]